MIISCFGLQSFIVTLPTVISNSEHLIPNSIPWLSIFERAYEKPYLLQKILLEYNLSPAELLQVSIKPQQKSEPYCRKILFKDSTIEVMLANWAFNATASPHNHGASQGLIWFAQGDFYEQHFLFNNQRLTPNGDPIDYRENSVVRVDTLDIHSCCPVKTGLSLHLYCPPIHGMRVWDIINKRTLEVEANCGAWIPEDQKLILKEAIW